MHQYTKNELNWLRNGPVIGADARTRFPPTQTILPKSKHFILVYIALKPLYRGK